VKKLDAMGLRRQATDRSEAASGDEMKQSNRYQRYVFKNHREGKTCSELDSSLATKVSPRRP